MQELNETQAEKARRLIEMWHILHERKLNVPIRQVDIERAYTDSGLETPGP